MTEPSISISRCIFASPFSLASSRKKKERKKERKKRKKVINEKKKKKNLWPVIFNSNIFPLNLNRSMNAGKMFEFSIDLCLKTYLSNSLNFPPSPPPLFPPPPPALATRVLDAVEIRAAYFIGSYPTHLPIWKRLPQPTATASITLLATHVHRVVERSLQCCALLSLFSSSFLPSADRTKYHFAPDINLLHLINL